MSSQVERFQEWLVSGESTSRRRFLLRVGRAGFATFASMAGVSVAAQRVAASQQVQCCNLAYAPNFCPGGGDHCPSGCNCYEWTCCSNQHCRFRCGECDSQACSYIAVIGKCTVGGICPTSPM